MRKLTKQALQKILDTKLSLKNPEYHLKRSGNRWAGEVVSTSFRGKRDMARLKMIWNALDEVLGEQSARQVGFLFPLTPDEWNLDAVYGFNGAAGKNRK